MKKHETRRKIKSKRSHIKCTCGNILKAEVVILSNNQYDIIVEPCICSTMIVKSLPIGLKELK